MVTDESRHFVTSIELAHLLQRNVTCESCSLGTKVVLGCPQLSQSNGLSASEREVHGTPSEFVPAGASGGNIQLEGVPNGPADSASTKRGFHKF